MESLRAQSRWGTQGPSGGGVAGARRQHPGQRSTHVSTQQKMDSPDIEERGPCSSFLRAKAAEREGGGPDPGRLFLTLWDCSRGT